MNVEERLRDALGAYAATVEPEIDAAPLAPAPAAPDRRAWRATVAGLAVVAVMVAALAVALTRGVDDSGPAAAPTPDRVVAITADHHLVVLSLRQDRIVRTLAIDVVLPDNDFGPQLAVTPDGRRVFFVREDPNVPCGNQPYTEIDEVSTSGGAAKTVVGPARSPAVTPDGHYLAFADVPQCSDGGDVIRVRDLRARRQSNGSYDRLWTLHPDPADFRVELGGITRLSWAPDSRRLAFVWLDAPADTAVRVLHTTATTSSEGTPINGVLDPGQWLGYLGLTGKMITVSPPCMTFPLPGPAVVSFDPGTGRRAALLFSLDKILGCPSTIVSDRSGRNLLAVMHAGTAYFLDSWHVGGARPVRSVQGVVAAAWLP